MGKVNPMDALKAALAERQAKAQKTIAETGQKWVKRGVLEKQRQEEYHENQRQEEEKQRAEEQARREKMEQHFAQKESSNPILNQDEKTSMVIEDALLEDDDADPPIGMSEVTERLREMGEPITLFGETDMQRYKRLRRMEKEAHEGKKNPDVLMLEQVHSDHRFELTDGQAGEKKEGEAEEEEEDDDNDSNDEEEEAPDVVEEKSDSEDEGEGVPGEAEEKGDSEDETPEAAAAKPAEVAQAEPEFEEPTFDLETMDNCDFIRGWVRKSLKAWEKELADRPDEDKGTAKMKVEMAAHRQVRRDVRPLQKRLRLYRMDEYLLPKVLAIVKLADEREYRDASEAYLDLSIGKAAWPVGLGCGGSMLMEDAIGLHDKFNRNAQVKDIAFAMNDEVVRKYVQALKRLMNVAQRHWPPADPSKAST